MKTKAKVLVVDDEQVIRESLGTILEEEGYQVSLASDGKEAIDILSQEIFHIIFCDIRMPKADGFAVLKKAVKLNPETFFIVITAFGDMNSAIQALRYGAFDYITKPLLFDDILIKIEHLLRYKNLITENQILKKEIEEKYSFDQIIGQGPEMREIYSLMRKVSATHNTLLITGERGTGKKIVAKAIHYNSPRKSYQFIGIQCGSVSEEVLDQKLFGFHNEDEYYKGVFVDAHKGTIFLDDIDLLPSRLQEKIFQVIEHGSFVPFRSQKSEKVDVRVIAATNKDLVGEINAGTFNEKLFDKINSCEIKMPPLRARRNDIPFLIKYFIRKYNNDLGTNILFVEEGALRAFMNYDWPGNIRELANVMERALMTTNNTTFLTEEDVPADIANKAALLDTNMENIKEAMRIYETHHIKEVLAKHNQDKKHAAHALGLSLSSLYRKLEELSIH
ncbi:MAG: sigma-54-dependent Fis family transcriptional regulator [Deltaproteobacteria bacterium]|nr:sigma-54-dependent Fis family transcriptional regulator [Deltaproteobacteria bacterium]